MNRNTKAIALAVVMSIVYGVFHVFRNGGVPGLSQVTPEILVGIAFTFIFFWGVGWVLLIPGDESSNNG